jgi:K(+)-stimulated pyrophosphate-energized sodium pump
MIKIFTSTESGHVREIVTCSREGGASLNVLSGLTAGNFSAFWMGIVIVGLMAIAYLISGLELAQAIPLARARRPASFRSAWSPSGSWAWAPDHCRGSVRPGHDNAQSVSSCR